MDNTDDTDETDLAVMSGAPSWVQTYASRSADLAKRRDTSRAEQLKANTAMLEKAYAGPSRSQQLFALSQAFLQPTRTGGGRFAQVMNNVVGALGGTNQQMQEAQQKRAMAALQLNNTYANEGFEGEEEALKRDLALQTLLQKGRGGYSYQLDPTGRLREVPKDVARPTTEAEYNAIPVGAYYLVPSGPDAGNVIRKLPPQR